MIKYNMIRGGSEGSTPYVMLIKELGSDMF